MHLLQPVTPLGSRVEATDRQPRFFYGWIIVAVSFITLFLVVGSRFSLGVFYVALMEEFHWSRANTAGVFALMLVVHAVFSLGVGKLFDRIGPRRLFPLGALVTAIGFAACSQINAIWQLYVFLGFVSALGITALAFVPHMALVSTWFKRQRGLATGIAYSGIGGGVLILAPYIQTLISNSGWRLTFVILASAIVVIVIPLTAIFHRHRPQDIGLAPDGDPLSETQGTNESIASCPNTSINHDWSVMQAIRTRTFWFLVGTGLSMGLLLNTLMVHQMAHVLDIGFSKTIGALVLGLVGALRSFGGMIFGGLSDRLGREYTYMLGTIISVVGLILLMTLHAPTQTGQLYAFAVLYGLGHGGLGPIYASSTADLFPGRALGTIMGCLEAAYGIGGALGTFTAGYMYDLTGHYQTLFTMVIAATIISCLCLWLAGPRHRHL